MCCRACLKHLGRGYKTPPAQKYLLALIECNAMIKAIVIILVLVFFAATVIQAIRRPDGETIRRPIENIRSIGNTFSQFFQSVVMAIIKFLVMFLFIFSFFAANNLVDHSGQKQDIFIVTFLIMIGIVVGTIFLLYVLFNDDYDDE